jgi:hypothetical protein
VKYTIAVLFAAALLAAGCNDNKTTSSAVTLSTGKTTAAATTGTASEADEVKANLAKLSPEDRALAEKQKYCVEQPDELLGSMGVPVKVSIKGDTVFVCCKSCEKNARKDPDKAIAKAKELREKNSKK